jgi:sulfonate transport system permease protein
MVYLRRLHLGPVAGTTLASLVLVVGAWLFASAVAGIDGSGQRFVPGPVDLINSFDRFADYWPGGLGVASIQLGGKASAATVTLGWGYNTLLTLFLTVAGVVLGTVVSLALAVGVSWSSYVRRAASLPAHVGRLLPLLAMTALFALWFGDSHLGYIFFVAFTSFALVFPIALGAIANVPQYYSQYSRSLGAGAGRTYFEVVLPAALPPIRSGVLLAVGFGWSAAIAAEYVSAQYGLGHVVKNAEYFGRTGLLGLIALEALALAAISLYLTDRGLRWATRWAE